VPQRIRALARAAAQASAIAATALALACSHSSTATAPTGTPGGSTSASSATVTVSPATLTFAAPSSPPQAVTLANGSTAIVNLTSITTTGNFTQTNNCPAALPVGGACTITVSFTALSATAPANSSGTVVITDDAPGSPQNVALTGPIVTSATGRLSPPSLDFGEQAVGTTSAPRVVTLTNLLNGVSTVPLGIISVQTNGDFAVAQNSCPASLPAGSSCTLAVAFTPSAAGSRTGTLSIFNNAPGGLLVLPLTGTGR